MKNDIKILDCTLRDGGYLNNWNFSNNDIEKIITDLIKANVNFIEIGFIKNKKDPASKTVFSSFDEIADITKNISEKSKLCAMIPYGFFDEKDIPEVSKSPIEIIRFIYKKQDMKPALRYAKKIKKKGYKLFINPTYVHQYDYDDMIETVKMVNKINPFCFSLVDSVGFVGPRELSEMFYTIDETLNTNIILGYHSHGSQEHAFTNTQELLMLPKNRNLIIDSTLCGMGRNSGNLKTEIFANFLNEMYKKNYDLETILKLSKGVISPILKELQK